jgi:hypothetical protein
LQTIARNPQLPFVKHLKGGRDNPSTRDLAPLNNKTQKIGEFHTLIFKNGAYFCAAVAGKTI